MRQTIFALCALVIAACGHRAGAETVKIGVLKTLGSGILFVAQEKGYFAAEGLAPEFVYFDSATPVPSALVSGDIDFGTGGLTGSFYGLAGQGSLRIISGGSHERSGFRNQAYLVSNRGYAAGLRGYEDFPGHIFGIGAIGSPAHYALALLADKYGFDLKSVQLVPLQSIPNSVTAIEGARVDFAVMPGTAALPVLKDGAAKLLGWLGDETPYQIGAIEAATRTTDNRRDFVDRFLRAYVRAVRDYHDAFIGPQEERRDAPAAPELLALLAKFTGLPPEQVRQVIFWMDAQARLDVADVLRQIAWYRAQGMVKGEFDPASIIDKRYVVPLP